MADVEGGVAPASAVDATPAARSDATRRLLALGLMVASGFAALGYQIVWTQKSTVWLGHESAAVLAVVAAFFGGLGIGALALGPHIDRGAHPERWYAACEVVIAVWSVVLALLMTPVAAGLLAVIGTRPSPPWHWTVAFCGTALLLLPATAAMGATLPAMERMLTRMRGRGTQIGALYAANTFGAVLGVLAAAFWLVPELGLARTAGVCAAINLLCAVGALRLFGGSREGTTAPGRSGLSGALVLLAATGLLGIGYEVLVVRVLSQVAENTVYTFAILLAVYLVGTALGAAAYQRWLAGTGGGERLRDHLLYSLAAACLLGLLCLAGADAVKSGMLQLAARPGMVTALAAEAAIAFTAFFLPTVLMGALFSHLCATAREEGVSFGRTLGVNTLGAATAPLLFGVLLIPAIGVRNSMVAVAAGYLALAMQRAWSAPSSWALSASLLVLWFWGPSLTFVDVPAGGRVISHQEGVMAAVSIVEDAEGVARLHINNRQQEGSNATVFADGRQALLPLLLHPAPRQALFLGLGTGVTASVAARDASIKVDAVELLPEVIEASAFFRQPFEEAGPNPRLRLVAADARRFVRASRQRYDLIVSDNFHPARSGSGSLYTVEHFEAVRIRLTPGGVFCQWLPLHQLDLETLRSIVRAFLVAFPDGWAMLATHSLDTPVLGLIAREDGERFDVARVQSRLATATMALGLAAFGLDDEFAVLGGFIAGPRALARFAGNAPLNTDDRPVVAYRAPRTTYAADSLPRDRLIALLREVEIRPDELVAAPQDEVWPSRLAAYWVARDRFIEAGREVRPTADVRRMLAQVREPLLSVLRISPDFRPAYDPLLRMATALGRSDVAAARALLIELQQAQPARPEAARALRDLSGAAR